MKRSRLFAAVSGAALVVGSGAAFASTIVPKPLPPEPITAYKTYDRTRPSFLATLAENGALYSSTNQLTLSGSATRPSAPFSYVFGTTQTSNPAIGLDFRGSGPITYTYNMPFEVSYEAPLKALPGSSFKVDPFLELAGAPALKAVQDITFGTDFFFNLSVDMPWPIPNVDVDVDEPLPNFELQGVSVTTSGTRLGVTTTGSTTGDFLTAPDGYLTVTTGETEVDAWAASADLIRLADRVGIPGMGLLDTLGFDMDLAVGMSIQREDALLFLDYDFGDILIDVPDVAPVNVPMRFEVETELTYSLVFQSRYDYAGSLSMNFDGPFFDPVELFDLDLGDFDVGSANWWLYDLTLPVTLVVDVEIADPDLCRVVLNRLVCFDPNPAPLAAAELGSLLPPELTSGQTTSLQELTFMFEASDEFVNLYEQATVPEPSSIALVAAGLLALGRHARRRK